MMVVVGGVMVVVALRWCRCAKVGRSSCRWSAKTKCDRVTAAADAAVQATREEEAELKLELQRTCVGDVEGVIQEQAQLLADVELAAASPDAAVVDSEASRCLLTAVTHAPLPPQPGAGGERFEAAAAEAVKVRRLGRAVGGGGVGLRGRAGGVSAVGAGFLRLFGSDNSGNGQFSTLGRFVVCDVGNHRVQGLE